MKRNEDVTNEKPMLTRKRKKGEETAKNSLRSLYEDINKDMVKMIKGCNVQRESMREGRVLAESDVIYVQRNITKAAESFVNRIFFFEEYLHYMDVCAFFILSCLFLPFEVVETEEDWVQPFPFSSVNRASTFFLPFNGAFSCVLEVRHLKRESCLRRFKWTCFGEFFSL